jgi:hypothetical protein
LDQINENDGQTRELVLLRAMLRYTAGQPAQAFDELLRGLSDGSQPTDRELTAAIRAAWATNDPQRLALLRDRLRDSVAGFPAHLLVAVDALLNSRFQEAVAAMRRAAQDAVRTTDITELAIGASLAAFTGDNATARQLATST